MDTVLITGGSGLIGRALTRALLAEGHAVRHLGRGRASMPGVEDFRWDPSREVIDGRALIGVDHIVHLAGAGIADKRWTAVRVKELIDSRTGTALLLLRTAHELGVTPRSFVSAAGINYYGAVTSDHVFVEDDPPGGDTIAHISVEWEEAVDAWSSLCRVVKLRTAVVLAAEGGALPKLALPVRFGLAAALGSGRQWMPWVHIDDLVSVYQQALFDGRMQGPYNVVAEEHATNADFMRTLARVVGRPFFLPPVPGVALRLALGELSDVLLKGSRASNARLLSTGFQFRHPRLEEAMRSLFGARR